MQQHGAGWIVYEESYHKGTRALVSIIPARRSAEYVADFMRQTFVDRWASVQDRLTFNKSPKSWPYQIMVGRHCNPMHIGDDPYLVGLYAHEIMLDGSNLTFSYRILTNVNEKLVPTFEERQQSLVVAA